MTDVEPLAAADYDAPLWLQALTYPGGVDRDLIDAVFTAAGVIGSGDLLVAPRGAGPNMSVDIAPGKVVVAGTDVAGQGKYLGRVKNTINVPISAAPAAGLTRIDLIHAHVADATVIGGTLNSLTVETPVVGTAASSGWVAPPTPASSTPLAQITVASGTAAISAAMITDVRHWLFASTATLVQSGSAVATTDASGYPPRVLYPTPYRAGTIPAVVVMSGDLNNWIGYAAMYVPGTDNAGFQFFPYGANGQGLANRPLRYNWIAQGQL
jgi:hypothetical protein